MLRSWLPPYLRSPEVDGSSGPAAAQQATPAFVLGQPPAAPAGGDPAKGTPAAPTLAPAPAASPAPNPAAAPAGGDPAKGTPAADDPASKPVWTLDSLLAQIGPKDLKEGDPRFSQWKDVKEMVKKATELNTRLTTEAAAFSATETALKTELAEAKKGLKTGESTPADVVALQTQLTKLQEEHKVVTGELDEFRAKGKLNDNPAFKQKYDGGRATIFNEAKSLAEQLKLDVTKLDDVFAKGSEYEIHKAIAALELKDPTAEKLLASKAVDYMKLGAERDALLSGKSGKRPSELAADWDGYHAEMGGALTRQFTTEMQGRILGAIDTTATQLAESSPTFKTDVGGQVLEEIRQRFQAGFDVPYEEVVSALAWNRLGPIFESQSIQQATEIRNLKAQLAELVGQSPSNATKQGSSDAGGGAGGGSSDPSDPFQQRKPAFVLGQPAPVASH